MNNSKPEDFFGESSNFDFNKIRIEIPAHIEPTDQEKITSSTIHLRGRAMRTMSSGRVRWWVLIAGWILFGASFSLLLNIFIPSMFFLISFSLILFFLVIIPYSIIGAIPVLIVWRGTLAKLSAKQPTRKCQPSTKISGGALRYR
ncbi:hypothetical protein [Anabaena sp. CCY 9402-a]|uniref:hypothetical protein n=1 Tax=Anabaena sp. CCY 9402-a TaxID=3103867 RepID=UPI0039C6F68F